MKKILILAGGYSKEKEVSIVYQDEDRFNPIKFKILSVSDRYDEHVADFSKDYLKIQKLALQNKQLKEIEKWQNDKIFDTYININNDFGAVSYTHLTLPTSNDV